MLFSLQKKSLRPKGQFTVVVVLHVAAAWSWCFAIFVNKFCKIMKIFE